MLKAEAITFSSSPDASPELLVDSVRTVSMNTSFLKSICQLSLHVSLRVLRFLSMAP